MVVFNGADLQAVSDKLNIVDVIVYPPAIQQTVVAPALMNGDIFSSKKYGTRQVDVLFTVLEEETVARTRILQAVNAWAASSSEQELRVPQEPDGYLMAVCSKPPQNSANAFEEQLILSFTCHDPFFYANEEKSAVMPGPSLTPFLEQDTAPPWRIEATIYEPLSSATQWGIGDKHLIFSSIPAGKLVIDRKRQTATVDGKSILASLQFGSRFFDLEKTTYYIDAGYPSVIFWRERWL